MKICKKCKELKPLSDFNKCSRLKDGHQQRCRVCCSIMNKQRYTENKDKLKEQTRGWRLNNPEKNKQIHQKWRAANMDRIREMSRRATRKARSTIKGKLSSRISAGIWRSLNSGSKKGRHWEACVGYTVDQLKVHLEKKFQPGMTWDNYGEWHIDHKIPIAAFNFEGPGDIDFKRCWALKNLRPMWASENISKGAKLEKPFQPSLPLASEVAR